MNNIREPTITRAQYLFFALFKDGDINNFNGPPNKNRVLYFDC